MPRLAALAIIVCSSLLGVMPSAAADRETGAADVELSAQSREGAVRPRPRARVLVRPYACRNYVTTYPLPYDQVECPGPNAVRLCDFKLVQELRPSGPVIVPRQRCWWARR